MSNIKTVPNQKVIKVNKEPCNKSNYYAAINLEAMEAAAVALDAACFKLWIYFAKNQNNYEFALSSKAVNDTFGMKKDQYDRAIKVLEEKGYLVKEKGNHYSFREVAAEGKNHNESDLQAELREKTTTALQENPTTMLQENPIRNITNNTINNITASAHLCALPTNTPQKTEAEKLAAYMSKWYAE